MNEPHMPETLKSLEAELAALAPNAERLDREQLIFLAGQAWASPPLPEQTAVLAANLHSKTWPAAFAAMTAVAAVLLVVVVQTKSRIAELTHKPTAIQKPDVITASPTFDKHDSEQTEPFDIRYVLTPAVRDLKTLDRLLAEDRRANLEPNQIEIQKHEPSSSKLTPTSWRSALEEIESIPHSPEATSIPSHNLGISI